MKKIFVLFLGLIFLFLQGCSSLNSKVVAVDSYAAAPIPGGTYFLSSNTSGLQLQQDAFAMNLQNMLATKGYTRVYNKKDAMYNIVFNYNVSGPFTSVQSYPVPVNPWWGPGIYDGVYGGYFGPTWVNSVDATTYFVKKLELSAYNLNNQPIWQVVGSMKSSNSDLRDSFPYLVSGISLFIDRSSNQIMYVNVNENEKTGALIPIVSQ